MNAKQQAEDLRRSVRIPVISDVQIKVNCFVAETLHFTWTRCSVCFSMMAHS